MSRIISFPQAFALMRGANYPYRINFTGVNPKTLFSSNGFTFNLLPNAAPYISGLGSPNLVNILANSTNVFKGRLIFKTGGNISTLSSINFFPSLTIVYLNGFNYRKFFGHFLFIGATANGAFETGSCYLENKNAILELREQVVGRCILTSSLTPYPISNPQQNATNTNSATGHIYMNDIQNLSVYFKGFVNPLEGSVPNSYGDARIMVGFFREHASGATSLLYHPTGGTPTVPFNGVILGFTPFYVNGQYTWYAFICGRTATVNANTVFFSQTTGLNAHVSQRLQVNLVNAVVTFIANGTTIATQNLGLLAANNDFDFDAETLNAGCGMRSVRLPAGTPLTNRQRLTVETLITTPDVYGDGGYYSFASEVNSPTSNNLDAAEEAYQLTGLSIMKKLK